MTAENHVVGFARSSSTGGLRLRRVIVLETLLVTFVGFMIWGFAWEMGFPRVGMGVAILVWLTVSPVIEIATVMKYRRADEGDK